METQNLSDTLKPPKFLITGNAGGGKTTALKTFPPQMKGLILNMFGNPQVLTSGPNAQNIEIIDYENYDIESGSAFAQMEKDRKELENLSDFPYDWIALDTATGLSRVCEQFALAAHPGKKGMGGSPAEHHYRGISWLVAQYLYSIIARPCIVVVNAHLEDEKDDRLGTLIYRPYMAGTKNRKTIAGYFSEVYYAFGEPSGAENENKNNYLWQTAQDTSYTLCKSTLNKDQAIFGTYIKPSYSELLERTGYLEGPVSLEGGDNQEG